MKGIIRHRLNLATQQASGKLFAPAGEALALGKRACRKSARRKFRRVSVHTKPPEAQTGEQTRDVFIAEEPETLLANCELTGSFSGSREPKFGPGPTCILGKAALAITLRPLVFLMSLAARGIRPMESSEVYGISYSPAEFRRYQANQSLFRQRKLGAHHVR